MTTSTEVAERRARVIQLRAAGATFGQIAKATGLTSAGAAAVDLKRALEGQRDLVLAEPRLRAALDLERLDQVERNIQAIMQNAAGGGNAALADPPLVLACVDRLLRIGERRDVLTARQAAGWTDQEAADQLRKRRDVR